MHGRWYAGILLMHFLLFLLAWGIWNTKFCCRRVHAARGVKCCHPHGARGDHDSFISTRRGASSFARQAHRSFAMSTSSQAMARTALVAQADTEEAQEFAGVNYGTGKGSTEL